MSDAAPTLSIVIPTYQEEHNLPVLAEKVHAALAGHYAYELIIANDDSGDHTPTVCEQLAHRYPLRLLNRTSNRGLSPAVIDGMRAARGKVIIVMDADLSHPPQKIVELAQALISQQADFVVGSRYVQGGGMDERWPWWRLVNSLAATLPARLIAPLADPMSGFFGLRTADVPPLATLSPIGYKIGLELIVKGRFAKDRVLEIPIYFRERLHGASKMNWREQLNYLRHLRRLYHYRWQKPMEVLQFLIVGTIGLVVDIVIYLALLAANVPHLWARGLSFWPAVTSNWFLNRVMTFKEREHESFFTQWLRYALFSVLSFLINWGTYALLTTHIKLFSSYNLAALLVGVLVGTVFNFAASNWIVFKNTKG